MFGLPHAVQFFLFFKSLGLGMVTGFVCLFFCLLRGLIPHKSVAVFFEDVLFFCVSALLLYYFLFTCNAGIPRLYLLAGDFSGACLCFYCFRPAVDRACCVLRFRRKAESTRKAGSSRPAKGEHPPVRKLQNRINKLKNKKKSEKTEKRLDFSN